MRYIHISRTATHIHGSSQHKLCLRLIDRSRPLDYGKRGRLQEMQSGETRLRLDAGRRETPDLAAHYLTKARAI